MWRRPIPRLARWLPLCALLCGCGTADRPSPDLAAPPVEDLASEAADLAPPPSDLGSPDAPVASDLSAPPDLAPPLPDRLLVNTINQGSGAWIEMAQFKAYVDAIEKTGIQVVRLNHQWRMRCLQCALMPLDFNAEPSPGVYDLSSWTERLDYVIQQKHMRAVVTINLSGQLDTDPLQPGAQSALPTGFDPSDCMLQRNNQGQDVPFVQGQARALRFERPVVRKRMEDFVKAAVTQLRARYGESILFYSVTLTPFGESEYPFAGYPAFADTSPEAAVAFQAWLKTRYKLPADVSNAWGVMRAYADFNLIPILGGPNPAPPIGQAPRPYQDFMAYREFALARFLGELRDIIHGAGGRALAQFGSTWDFNAATRGTYGIVQKLGGFDLVLIDDAPGYNHKFSVDWVRTNAVAPALVGNEVDAPCTLACVSGNLGNCCNPQAFPGSVDIPTGIKNLDTQVSDSFGRGARWVDLANWDNFWMKAFPLYANSINAAVTAASQPAPLIKPAQTIKMSVKDLYVHHHDQPYLDAQLLAHKNAGGALAPIAVVVTDDL